MTPLRVPHAQVRFYLDTYALGSSKKPLCSHTSEMIFIYFLGMETSGCKGLPRSEHLHQSRDPGLPMFVLFGSGLLELLAHLPWPTFDNMNSNSHAPVSHEVDNKVPSYIMFAVKIFTGMDLRNVYSSSVDRPFSIILEI